MAIIKNGMNMEYLFIRRDFKEKRLPNGTWRGPASNEKPALQYKLPYLPPTFAVSDFISFSRRALVPPLHYVIDFVEYGYYNIKTFESQSARHAAGSRMKKKKKTY